jgi:hypothetical protein
MAKFVEFTLGSGKKITVNTDKITLVLPLTGAGKTLISIDGSHTVGGSNFSVTESYDDVRAMIY